MQTLVMDPAAAGLLPNVISLNTLLACVRRSSDWRAALLAFSSHEGPGVQGVMNLGDLLLAIRKARVHPDGISHATAVSACADAVKWAEALALLSEIDFTPRTQRTLKAPQIAAVTTVLTACSSVSKWLQGLELLADAADTDDFDAAVVGAMVNACALGQAWELAVATWQSHQGHSNEVVHRSAIAACELGSWRMALGLLQLYHHRYGLAGTAGTAMATVAAMAAAAKATQWPLVLKLLEETGWRPGWDLLLESLKKAKKE